MINDLQKAPASKRISAFLCDFITACIIAVGIAVLLSGIVNYDGEVEKLNDFYTEYEEKYGIDTDISQEEYDAMSDYDREKYDEASRLFGEDERIIRQYSVLLNLSLLVTSISIFVSMLIVEFIIPLFFKNGQTLGKKVFGVALMRADGVKISPFQLFVRAMLGKYTIETMIPVFMILMIFFGFFGPIGTAVVIFILLLQFIFIIATKTNSAIHDVLAVTIAVDMASQMIFESEEHKKEYLNRISSERAEDLRQ